MFSHQKLVILTGDIFALVLAFCVMSLLRFDIGAQGNQIWYQLNLFAVLFAIWLIVFFVFDLYTAGRINPNPRNIGLLIGAMIINTLLAIVLFYLTPNSGITPKTNLAILVVSALILLVIWRRMFYLLFSKHLSRKIILIGSSPLMTHLRDVLHTHRHLGTVVAIWSSPVETTDIAADLVIADAVDPQELLKLSRTLRTETMSLVEAYETLLAKIPVELMTPERAVHLMTNHSTTASRAIYRILEIIIAVVVLIVVSPFLVIALTAKWIEDGTPLFIKQSRVGKDGKDFYIYKIRTMTALGAHGLAETTGAKWADKNDSRITPVGAILRKTHIDEVPQMWNVIKGDLALIGPRAERPEFVAELERHIPYYYLRHTIKPGFTGWAQIKFRYARSIEDSKEKFEYDLYYLKNKHPLLDLGIVVKTAQIIFTH